MTWLYWRCHAAASPSLTSSYPVAFAPGCFHRAQTRDPRLGRAGHGRDRVRWRPRRKRRGSSAFAGSGKAGANGGNKGAPETYAEFEHEVDETICAVTPESFHAVGQFYEDFSQTPDEEVRDLLAAAVEVRTRT